MSAPAAETWKAKPKMPQGLPCSLFFPAYGAQWTPSWQYRGRPLGHMISNGPWLRVSNAAGRSAAAASLGSNSSTGDGNSLGKPEASCLQGHQPVPELPQRKDPGPASSPSHRARAFPARNRHGYFQGEAPGPGTSGHCAPSSPPGPFLRRPGVRHGRPAGRRHPALPLRPPRGLRGPRRGCLGVERPPPPYLRVCGWDWWSPRRSRRPPRCRSCCGLMENSAPGAAALASSAAAGPRRGALGVVVPAGRGCSHRRSPPRRKSSGPRATQHSVLLPPHLPWPRRGSWAWPCPAPQAGAGFLRKVKE